MNESVTLNIPISKTMQGLWLVMSLDGTCGMGNENQCKLQLPRKKMNSITNLGINFFSASVAPKPLFFLKLENSLGRLAKYFCT